MNPKKNFANWIAKHPKLWVGHYQLQIFLDLLQVQ